MGYELNKLLAQYNAPTPGGTLGNQNANMYGAPQFDTGLQFTAAPAATFQQQPAPQPILQPAPQVAPQPAPQQQQSFGSRLSQDLGVFGRALQQAIARSQQTSPATTPAMPPQQQPAPSGFLTRLTQNVQNMRNMQPAPGGIIGRLMQRSGAQFAEGGGVHAMAHKYQVGGAVRRFQIGGNEGQPMPPENMLDAEPPAPAPVTASPAAQPLAAARPTTTPVSPAAQDLMGLFGKYLDKDSVYAPELAAARERVGSETKAFNNMIQAALKEETAVPDKSEMYFRLAAAFGAPTRTGNFAENLSMVGKELGEYAKDVRTTKRAEKQAKLQLGLEAQKLKAQGAREELGTLRALTAEEMKDKRAILQEYIKTGMPQSEAGKAAADAGLQRGTPEFTNFVNKYLEDKIATGNMLKEAMVAIAAGQLQVAQGREQRAVESGKKLTPAEVKMKAEAEATVGGLDDAMGTLRRAYSLNPNTFDGTLASIAQRKILEQTNPKDPRVLATREQSNLLSKGAIEKLRASFGGNPTEGERAALLALEGIDAKSKDERAMIMKNTYKLLQDRRAREQKRLNDITAGLYRETTPSAGDLE